MPLRTPDSPALCTDQYELAMFAGALADGSAFRRCRFEVFARGLRGHRYGIVAGVARLLDTVVQRAVERGRDNALMAGIFSAAS